MPPEGWDAEKDYQLERALTLLRDGTVAARIRTRATAVAAHASR